jgi:hypothetical protein
MTVCLKAEVSIASPERCMEAVYRARVGATSLHREMLKPMCYKKETIEYNTESKIAYGLAI